MKAVILFLLSFSAFADEVIGIHPALDPAISYAIGGKIIGKPIWERDRPGTDTPGMGDLHRMLGRLPAGIAWNLCRGSHKSALYPYTLAASPMQAALTAELAVPDQNRNLLINDAQQGADWALKGPLGGETNWYHVVITEDVLEKKLAENYWGSSGLEFYADVWAETNPITLDPGELASWNPTSYCVRASRFPVDHCDTIDPGMDRPIIIVVEPWFRPENIVIALDVETRDEEGNIESGYPDGKFDLWTTLAAQHVSCSTISNDLTFFKRVCSFGVSLRDLVQSANNDNQILYPVGEVNYRVILNMIGEPYWQVPEFISGSASGCFTLQEGPT